MRYVELNETVDVIEVRKKLVELTATELKLAIDKVIGYVGKQKPNSLSIAEEQNIVNSIEDELSLAEGELITNFYKYLARSQSEFLNRYIKNKYGSEVKRTFISFKLKHLEYTDFNHKETKGNAGIVKNSVSGERAYRINLSVDAEIAKKIMLELSSDIIIDDAYIKPIDYYLKAQTLLDYTTIIHELEHVETFIKTNDRDFYKGGGHRTDLLGKRRDNAEEKENLSRRPSISPMNRFLYYTSNQELNTFSTQSADSIIDDYGLASLRTKYEKDHKELLKVINLDDTVNQVMRNLFLSYEQLEDLKTDKIEQQMFNTIRYFKKKVYLKLVAAINHGLPSDSPLTQFTAMTNNDSANKMAIEFISALLSKVDPEDLKRSISAHGIDAAVFGQHEALFDQKLKEVENVVSKLPKKVVENKAVINRIEKFAYAIRNKIIQELSKV